MSGATNAQKKALIVDDDSVNIRLLRAILQKEGYQVFTADNGLIAIDVFIRERPDIVLMDIMMPVMNGYEAARHIKALSRERFIPIIFLTVVTDEEALSKCVASGGDDFLTKPYNRIILRAKISAMERIRILYATLNQQKEELERYQANISHELEFASRIFHNVMAKGSMALPYVRILSLPMSMFNGDLLLCARKPAGGLHIMLCDFTGHGLPAAVGALPVSEVFVAMTERGFSINEIVSEMNRKLCRELPTGFFCAACLIDIDATQSLVRIWNGGLPTIFFVDQAGNIVKTATSTQLPLGIIETVVSPSDISVMEISPGLRLFLYTDGLIEASNSSGEKFSQKRLEAVLTKGVQGAGIFSAVQQELLEFRGEAQQLDDISLVDIDCHSAVNDTPDPVDAMTFAQRALPAEWKMSFNLTAGIIKQFNPVPVIINMLNQFRVPADHRRRIYTVLSELYSNALDHGLLQLESSMKKTPDGFGSYYNLREQRLSTLSNAFTNIDIEQVAAHKGYRLKLRVVDSGKGFDFKRQTMAGDQNALCGRGLGLVRSLCDELVYDGCGNTVEATYYWEKQG